MHKECKDNEERQEEHLSINIPEEDDSSSSEEDRLSDGWSSKIDKFVLDIKKQSNIKEKQHSTSSKYFNKKRISYGLPCALMIPLLNGIVAIISLSEDKVYVSNYVLHSTNMILGSLNAVIFFFNYEKRSTEHSNYASKYGDIVADINYEMHKDKEYRTNADVFMKTINMRFRSLDVGPDIPTHIENMYTS